MPSSSFDGYKYIYRHYLRIKAALIKFAMVEPLLDNLDLTDYRMKTLKECLIIDDDIDDQEIFLMCVDKISMNVNCRTAKDGVDAISMLTSDTAYIPDYIFVDVNMPKLNGIACLKLLKGIRRLGNTKIFMYSTTSELSVVKDSQELGADGFIVKPASTVELKARLSEIFSGV